MMCLHLQYICRCFFSHLVLMRWFLFCYQLVRLFLLLHSIVATSNQQRERDKILSIFINSIEFSWHQFVACSLMFSIKLTLSVCIEHFTFGQRVSEYRPVTIVMFAKMCAHKKSNTEFSLQSIFLSIFQNYRIFSSCVHFYDSVENIFSRFAFLLSILVALFLVFTIPFSLRRFISATFFPSAPNTVFITKS